MPTSMSLFKDSYFSQVSPDGQSSIHECSTDEVRRLYQERYRHFGGIPELRDIFSNFSCYTIVDDHDIVDNWGSDPNHQNDKWRAVGEGARWAYFDYQAGHLDSQPSELPESFHYEMDYGPVSVFVMDLRSQRWVTTDAGELYSKEQEDDLRDFLERKRDQKALFFVLSVPPIHLPRYLAATAAHLTPNGEDFSDRWSSLAHVDDRDRFMKLIKSHQRKYPRQRHLFLAGDIHVGCAMEVVWKDDGERLYQFVSSGLTNKAGRAIQLGARLLMLLNRQFDTQDGELQADVNLLPANEDGQTNPYGKLNIGIVRVSAALPSERATVEYFLYGHEGEEPVCVFQTKPL